MRVCGGGVQRGRTVRACGEGVRRPTQDGLSWIISVISRWEPTRLASKQKLFKKGWHDLRALAGVAALVKDSLALSIDEDGALAARWTESRAAVRLRSGGSHLGTSPLWAQPVVSAVALPFVA